MENYDYYFRWIVKKPSTDNSLWWKLLEKGLLAISYIPFCFLMFILEIIIIVGVYCNSVFTLWGAFLAVNIIFVKLLFIYLLYDIISNLIVVRKKVNSFELNQVIAFGNCKTEFAVIDGCIIGAFVLRNSPVSDKFLYIDFVGDEIPNQIVKQTV